MNDQDGGGGETRRRFLHTNLLGAAALGALDSGGGNASPADETPWYRRTYRWGQTNITENDPTRYDIAWWRQYWKRHRAPGRHHQRRRHRGLLSEQVPAAPPGRVPGRARPLRRTGQGRARGRSGGAGPHGFQPRGRGLLPGPPGLVRRGRRRQALPRGRLVRQPASTVPITTSICPKSCARSSSASHPEGFTDNSWSGLGRGSICYCENCARKFPRARPASLLGHGARLGRSGLSRMDSLELRSAAWKSGT